MSSLQLEHFRSVNLLLIDAVALSSGLRAVSSRRNWLSTILSVSHAMWHEGHSTTAVEKCRVYWNRRGRKGGRLNAFLSVH